MKGKHRYAREKKIAPLYFKYRDKRNQNRNDELCGDVNEDDGTNQETPATTLLGKMYEIYNPYEYIGEVEHEPMPLWLKLAIDIVRPVTVIQYYWSFFFAGVDEILHYDYVSATSAMNFIARVLGLVGVVTIVWYYFTSAGISLNE